MSFFDFDGKRTRSPSIYDMGMVFAFLLSSDSEDTNDGHNEDLKRFL